MSDTANGQKNAQVVVEVRPTVFVGLGGTGMEILLRLRRRILQADWAGHRLNSLAEFPVARFLYFDTDTNEARETGRAATNDPMAEAVAFGKGDTLQTKVDVGYYQKNRTNYPMIAEWLPSRDLSHIDTEKGAGQVRSISRLLFFDQFEPFRAAVAEKGRAVLANVSNQDALDRLELKTQKNLRVVVVGSVAGGTGSGAFIDVGLAIRSMVDPLAEQVDLFLMLPSGYAGANRDRVYANGFAALSELEHVMRPNPTPPYVKRWTSIGTSVEEASAVKPYNDVYLFDTRNVNGDRTEKVDDVFDMMADILFEDFGNSEFARRKRSTAVNQQQHKIGMFHPPVGVGERHAVLAYSQGYSAIGQSIVATTGSLEFEAAVSDASSTMLQAFFGVAEQSGGREPAVRDRDSLMRAKLFLTPKLFDDFPKYLSPRPNAVRAYLLVEQLLISNDLKSIHGRLAEDISAEFRSMREQASEPKDWATQAEKIRARYEAEVLAKAGTTSIRRDEIESAHQRLLRAITADDGPQSLRQALYDLVDDRENGGLDFTIALVEQIRGELSRDGTGIRAQLEQASIQFRAVADDIMTRHLSGSLKKLERAAKPGLLGHVDRASAEEYLRQFETDLGEALKFWLRATAALEAQKLLDDVAKHLGERSTPDDQGEVSWTGLLRELDEGRRSVRLILAMVAAEGNRVRDAVNRPDSGAYIVINRGGGRIADERVAVEPRAWAAEAFETFGGCRQLFPLLLNDTDRLRLINQLRAVAKRKMAAEERRIPSAVQSLKELAPDERRKVFERMLARAMPWFPASFDRFKPNGDQFKLIFAASKASEFRTDFLDLIKSEMPKGLGIQDMTIEESGVPGRIICYCELSGFPLDAISPLRDDWRKSYDKQLSAREPLPLHNHHDYLRFPNPVVPSIEELARQRESIETFLKAVMFGTLIRGSDLASGREDSRYYVDMSRNDMQSIGNERKVRIKGFDAAHLVQIKRATEQFEGGMTALQWVAAAALAQWTARRAYSPPLEEAADGSESRPVGLSHIVAMTLSTEFQRRATRIADAKSLPGAPVNPVNLFFDKIDMFTRSIDGSLADVPASDANRNSRDIPDRLAVDKRRIDPDRFDDAFLLTLVTQKATASALEVPAAPPVAAPLGNEKIDYDPAERLAQLKQFAADGLITQQEYDAKKAEILSRF